MIILIIKLLIAILVFLNVTKLLEQLDNEENMANNNLNKAKNRYSNNGKMLPEDSFLANTTHNGKKN